MLCRKPLTVNGELVGCGQCINCRMNKRREWTARILLEGLAAEKEHREVSWCTMTYNNESLFYHGRGALAPLPSLYPRDLQLLHKRLRKRKCLGSFRFVACGEYGDKSQRPHYHSLLFGPSPSEVEKHMSQQWDFGFVQVRPWRIDGEVSRKGKDSWVARAAYIAHYITKKMTGIDDDRLQGREPEFFLMSQSPPIGCSRRLLDLQQTDGGYIQIGETGDVSPTIRIAGEKWPLSETLRNYVRDDMGIPNTKRERRAMLKPELESRPPKTAEDYYRAQKTAERLDRKVGSNRRL